jgi:hypothetical protein
MQSSHHSYTGSWNKLLIPAIDSESTYPNALSCVCRRVVSTQRTEEELEATLVVLPEYTWQIGFHACGEFSPSSNDQCGLHNQTMTLLRESDAPTA